MTYPRSVELCEVGPRDGFQFEEKHIPTDLKVEIIRELAAAGLPRIQVASFVHPKWVPQMADAEDVFERIGGADGVVCSALVLNMKGLERARAAGVHHVDISIATDDRHSRANTNMTAEEAVEEGVEMVERAIAFGMLPQIGLQTVFGYARPGDTDLPTIVELAGRFSQLGVESISLADSTGMANPLMIKERLTAIQDVVGPTPVVVHLHDTRGLGMANVVASLECGVSRFDTSLGGLGGCPFIPGATGNIATEDTAYLLDSLSIDTGIDIERVSACSLKMESFLERRLPGRLHRLVGKSVSSG